MLNSSRPDAAFVEADEFEDELPFAYASEIDGFDEVA